jgi:hypothetical protein
MIFVVRTVGEAVGPFFVVSLFDVLFPTCSASDRERGQEKIEYG